MTSLIENKAMRLRDEAQKRMNSTGFLQTLFGGGRKIGEAIDYYTRAGNLFKLSKNWLQAATVFADAAQLNCETRDHLEAAIDYSEAGECFRKCQQIAKAVEHYLKAIALYLEMGRFLAAAKLHRTVAQALEDDGDINGARTNYERAAEFYREGRHYALANDTLQKVAECEAMAGRYRKAIKIFQEAACFDLSDAALPQRNAAEHLFKAAICHLCNDASATATAADNYCEMCPQFRDSSEHELIMRLAECVEDRDLEGYANVIRTFDTSSKLDVWHVTMLLRAKNSIDAENDLG
ncbi:alpha-soluble NSF attachment protein-like [Cylas formicarius]|uniref:alpha-soluble NSF attachment protein-like n=1 Tax=Cylas formicarius TaxID=197179 RepID=UPI00295834D7|nr:alpha-soluble NSF attachment protein-like [Cylas formicarius]